MANLCLGTVNFGVPYGINQYQVPKEEAFKILDYATLNGIDNFDTAKAYCSEEILGEYFRKNNKKAFITTKVDSLNIQADSSDSYVKLKNQYTEIGVLLHRSKHIYNFFAMSDMAFIRKYIKKVGVSVYNPIDAIAAAKMGFDIIQIPYSPFDMQLDKTDFFKICANNEVVVYSRSAFFKGILLMEIEQIPNGYVQKHSDIIENLIKFDKITFKHGFSKKEAAFLFSLTHPNIDYVTFGVESMEQLKENIDIYNDKTKWDKFFECREELQNEFADVGISLANMN